MCQVIRRLRVQTGRSVQPLKLTFRRSTVCNILASATDNHPTCSPAWPNPTKRTGERLGCAFRASARRGWCLIEEHKIKLPVQLHLKKKIVCLRFQGNEIPLCPGMEVSAHSQDVYKTEFSLANGMEVVGPCGRTISLDSSYFTTRATPTQYVSPL